MMLGRDFEPYRERTNTLVFYPHGSLALCRTAVEQEFKIHNAGEGLLEAILAEWRSERVVPLFVSEGTMLQKVSSIQNSYYLSTVYREVLTSQRFTLTLFGWGLGSTIGIYCDGCAEPASNGWRSPFWWQSGLLQLCLPSHSG